jgi:hypothetical protein
MHYTTLGEPFIIMPHWLVTHYINSVENLKTCKRKSEMKITREYTGFVKIQGMYAHFFVNQRPNNVYLVCYILCFIHKLILLSHYGYFLFNITRLIATYKIFTRNRKFMWPKNDWFSFSAFFMNLNKRKCLKEKNTAKLEWLIKLLNLK